jgi:lipopolysaccharide biosynthesis glycosyltransferase
VTDDRMHLAMCVDHGFALPLAVSLVSMETSTTAPVRVDVLHPGLPEATMRKVTAPLSRVEVVWRQVDDQAVGGAFFTDGLSSATLYRLLLGDVLDPGTVRVLYLDADTLVLDSLAELYSTDLLGHTVAAVRDAPSPWAAGPVGTPWRELGLTPSSPHMNAGVLLIDLERWRAERVGARGLEILRTLRPRWGDQDALNTVLEGRWLELPRRWNLQTQDLIGDSHAWALWPDDVGEAVARPAVVHITGLDKPWKVGSAHPMTEQWFTWLDRTAWSGWRPTAPRQRLPEVWARSAVRSARAWRERHATPALPE